MGSMKVTINSLTGYFRARFSHARRILPLGPGYVVEADQSQPIGKADLAKLIAPPKPPPLARAPVKTMASKSEKEAADKLLDDVVLENTDVHMPDWDEVHIGELVVETRLGAPAPRRRHQRPEPVRARRANAAAVLRFGDRRVRRSCAAAGPRHLSREEHAVSLHTGGTTDVHLA